MVSKTCLDQHNQIVEFEMNPADADQPPPIIVLIAASRADRPRPIILPDLRADAGQQRSSDHGTAKQPKTLG